jgi:hypothetical protein
MRHVAPPLSKLRRPARLVVGVLALAACFACAPLTPPSPFHFLETSQVLQKDQVAITVGAGGGATALDGNAGGGSLRVRAGAGHDQEIGVEVAALYVNTGKRDNTSPVWVGQFGYVGGKVVHKWAARPWFALVSGLGASWSATGLAFGGDFGGILSRPRGLLRPYAGARLSLALPARRDIETNGGVTLAITPAAGLAIVVTPNVRVYFEGGALLAWAELGVPDHGVPANSDGTYHENDFHGGGYGAVGLQFSTEKLP